MNSEMEVQLEKMTDRARFVADGGIPAKSVVLRRKSADETVLVDAFHPNGSTVLCRIGESVTRIVVLPGGFA